ncbi:MAG: hypothetical protein OJF62_003722 [Pseudolabrys sp.]|nr:hypothetical protein [Pseudolabrys sp.]
MITAADMALRAPVAVAPGPYAFTSGPPVSVPATNRERWVRMVLFVTMLLSGIAKIEPSPHDFMVLVMILVAFVAGIRFDRFAIPLFVLLLIWVSGVLMALPNVLGNKEAFTYAATSIYLSLAAVLFACLFAQDTMERMAVVRTAYIAAAVVCALAGTAGYFHLGGSHVWFTLYDRADGFFKDPNVFGPFLIWPALILVSRMLLKRFRLRDLIPLGIIMIGLLLSLSRGAWMHFLASAVIMWLLLFLTAREDRTRVRMIGMTALGAFLVVALFVALMSVSSFRTLFLERANALNGYDIGENGRFEMQALALQELLNYPFGMGPFEFALEHGLQQHNVYLQSFLVYGWAGGLSYIFLVLLTLLVGLRNALIATPWQIYAVIAFAVFAGEAGEGMVIDSDHWRHFFLILGMVWGLAAATRHHRRKYAPGHPPMPAVVP